MVMINRMTMLCRELRPKHWLKNGLIFLPLIFSGKLSQPVLLLATIEGTIVFCLLSSAVYIINDLADLTTDRQQIIKKQRPLAAGQINKRQAVVMIILLLMTACGLQVCLLQTLNAQSIINGQGQSKVIWLIMTGYLVINLLYSWGLKNLPVIDVVLLAAGFMLRLYYGGAVIGVAVSYWMALTVLAMSLYLSLGKRQKEAIHDGPELRRVLRFYTPRNLQDNMLLCLILTLLFYFLWTLDPGTVTAVALKGGNYSTGCLVATFFLVLLICLRYAHILKWSQYGDPIEIFFNDRLLQILFFIYSAAILMLIY